MVEPTVLHQPSGQEFRITQAPTDALRAVVAGNCDIENARGKSADISVSIAAFLLKERGQ